MIDYSWISQDITWCMSECNIQNCYRNPVNMTDKTGLHSFAEFKGTDLCPLKELLNEDRRTDCPD